MICTGETYKDHVKMTFAKGASLKDPAGLFNQEGTVRRAIDFHEGDKIDEQALKALIRAAVKLNATSRDYSTGSELSSLTQSYVDKFHNSGDSLALPPREFIGWLTSVAGYVKRSNACSIWL